MSSAPAHALVFGEPVAVSPIGAPLRVEITVPEGDASGIDECVRLAPGADDAGLPWVREARISTVGRAPNARILVEGRASAPAPAMRLGLEELCRTSLRREYTLLLPFPDVQPPSPTAGGNTGFRVAPPRARYESRSRFEPARRSTAEAAAPMPGLQRGEREVARTLDRLRHAQEELARRIQRLEQAREALMVQAHDLGLFAPGVAAGPEASAHRAPTPGEPAQRPRLEDEKFAPSAQPVRWPRSAMFAIFTALSLLLALALFQWRRRRKREVDAGKLDAANLFNRGTSTPGIEPPSAPDERPPGVATATAIPAGAVATTASVPATPHPPSAARVRPAVTDAPVAPPIAAALDEEAIEEHQSAIELAEILMGFGRIQGAAETLAEFIESNPRKSVAPWLKLLEVYRRGGLRPEFDAISRQLHRTFNVTQVNWETFDAARAAHDTLENLPHIAKTLQDLWGTTACQGYLERLLVDNRDGSRQGFPLNVVDEILTLRAVLEEKLGPYRTDDSGTVHAP